MGYGANVIWNMTFLDTATSVDPSDNKYYYGLGGPFFMSMTGTRMNTCLTLVADADFYMEKATKAWLASAGDLVSDKSLSQRQFFYYADIDHGDDTLAFSDYDIFLSEGESIYLAYAYTHYTEPDKYLYGWCSLKYTESEGLQVTGSAYDADGDPVIVGNLPTPEPNSAILLLFGSPLLLLRRWRLGEHRRV